MEHRNISLFRGYSDTESVETSLEEIVNIIKCDAALRDRTEKHRYYLQQDLRRDADREKSDRKSTRLNSSHASKSRMPSSA